ncbi:AbrB/MazE/SpoVT family DNA-binding domain-containing protein [Methylorubrum thiocyanatum]|uniref:Antitoxin MazE n=1 Tax=Methylorubrum thiocyanatum TaxID=47958 RepID=A0AA40V9L9_9HYPH|nr:AbrB/MazE/SpoVT family DNA-binding domain-containing protein [Methylorubrum thiocyanatum]MBA8912254.1 antitoxin MazE [Methylorubrum thiocyanatum]GJE81049.1 hypothetical protein CJNNKLLH_2391 [Methylorubrum thiocyanatum]
MEAKLVRWGDGLAVTLPAEQVRRLGMREGQVVEIVPKTPRMTLAEMIAEMRRLGPAYEPEAVDWGPDVGSEIIDDDDPR